MLCFLNFSIYLNKWNAGLYNRPRAKHFQHSARAAKTDVSLGELQVERPTHQAEQHQNRVKGKKAQGHTDPNVTEVVDVL